MCIPLDRNEIIGWRPTPEDAPTPLIGEGIIGKLIAKIKII